MPRRTDEIHVQLEGTETTVRLLSAIERGTLMGAVKAQLQTAGRLVDAGALREAGETLDDVTRTLTVLQTDDMARRQYRRERKQTGN